MSIPTNKLLEKVLDYTTLRQRVISENIANIGTANYKRKDVKFESELSNALDTQLHFNNSSSIENADFKIVTDNSQDMVSGMNNVDINNEMANMAQNTLLFKFAARKLNGYFRTLQGVIRGDMR
ncbi:flagellar basal body rod protein FlgB [bacterium BMS3Abin04]|nr:flagellar basal body rod protein FlgB [bacterium BMS3Abin04]